MTIRIIAFICLFFAFNAAADVPQYITDEVKKHVVNPCVEGRVAREGKPLDPFFEIYLEEARDEIKNFMQVSSNVASKLESQESRMKYYAYLKDVCMSDN